MLSHAFTTFSVFWINPLIPQLFLSLIFLCSSSPIALHLCVFVWADIYCEHVLVFWVVPVLLSSQAVGPDLPSPLPPLLYDTIGSFSVNSRGTQCLHRGPRALSHQGGAHERSAVGHDGWGGQVGRNNFLMRVETVIPQKLFNSFIQYNLTEEIWV